MSLRQSRGYKFFLVGLSLVCLIGAGYLAYLTFFAAGGSADKLKKAEAAYARGEAESDPNAAAQRFDEAAILAENGLNAFAGELQGGTPTDEQKKFEGKLNWVLARAIRDRAYAKAKVEGKPLPEQTDSTIGETYRNVFAIPDEKDRGKAAGCVMRAAELLRDDPKVILTATRIALTVQPLNWEVVERLLKDTIQFNANDSRANYFLARYEYDQPVSDGGRWTPRPAGKKDPVRVEKALEYLAAAEKNDVPYWRAAHLRAEILNYQATEGKSSRTAQAKRDALDELLFDKRGALERAARGEDMTALSMYDGNGILALHQIAMSRATADPVDPAKVKRVAENGISTAHMIAESKSGGAFVQPAADTMLGLLQEARRALKPADPKWWESVTADAEAFLTKYPAVGSSPEVIAKRTQLTSDPKAAAKLLEEGLATARKQKQPAGPMSDLLAELANTKLLANAPAAEVEPLIAELRELDARQVKARVDYLEGVLAERQGKLSKARGLYEEVLADKSAQGTPLGFLATVRLGPVCLASGDPNAAARHLGTVADRLKNPGSVTADEKAWLEQATAGRDEIVALQAVATIRGGVERILLATRRNPGEPIRGELKTNIEENVRRMIEGLRPPSKADRTARLALAEFELVVRDREKADELLARLAVDYPDDVSVLRTAIARIMLPEDGKKEPDVQAMGRADIRIDQFLRENRGSKAGKLFKAEWLIRTKRAADAVEYLKAVENFPDQDDVVKRLLAGALLQTGAREEAQQVLAQLPPDLGVELAIIQAAGSKEEAEKELKSAIGRYENNGLLRLYDGVLKLKDGKYEEAAKEFRAAGEFTAVKSAADTLLQRGMIAYAGADRKNAIPFIRALIQESPDKPGLYQAAALAAKYADDIGTPADQWPLRKTMYAAVNEWAKLSAAAAVPAETVGMVKVAYHEMAGAPQLARREAARVAADHPTHVPALLYLAQAYLTDASPNLTEAKKYIDMANAEAKADNPAPALLEGVWLEKSGKADEAAKLYERLMTQYPDTPAPYVRRVELAAAADNKGEAVSWARKWVDKSPTDGTAVAELIRRLAEAGETDSAVKKAEAWTQDRVTTAKAELDKSLSLTGEQKEKQLAALRAGVNLAAASGLFRAKKYAEAKKWVDQVLADDPDSGAARMMAGDIAMAAQNWDEAEKLYRTRLTNAPDDFIAANNLAWVLSQYKNDPKGALKLLDHARLSGNDTPVGVDRLPADFLDTYGRVYLKLNDPAQFEQMRKMFDEAVKRYPDDPRMHWLLGEAYVALGSNSPALASLNRAIQLASDPTITGVPESQKAEVKAAAEAARNKLGK